MIELALDIALQAHRSQRDKSGRPYIFHPLRVMLRFKNETEMIVAVLHDVVEDSQLSLEDLRECGFSEEIIEALRSLTKIDGEKCSEFISRASKNKLAKKIKIEDIKDNLDVTRLENISGEDLQRIKKYHRALSILEAAEES